MPLLDLQTAAAAGSTGNNTHTAVTPKYGVRDTNYAPGIALAFTISATGAGPTVAFKLQGSIDGTNYADVVLLPSDSDTTTASVTKTALGTYTYFVAQGQSRRYQSFQLVTSSNTNVTYGAKLAVVV